MLDLLDDDVTVVQSTDLGDGVAWEGSGVDGVVDEIDLLRRELTGLLECVDETGVAVVGDVEGGEDAVTGEVDVGLVEVPPERSDVASATATAWRKVGDDSVIITHELAPDLIGNPWAVERVGNT